MLEVADGEVVSLRARLEEVDRPIAGRWCQGRIHFCLSHSSLSLSDCPVPFSELDLDVADLREGVDEVVAFVCT